MIDGQPKAIQLQGITHNTTKIGVQDGQSEDLVNLRFKDGAWRSTGDGKYIMDVGKYQQIFIHTNVYRHMLGVKDGKLWWFATADSDDPSAFDMIQPVEICKVAEGDVKITQTGHLITVIDSADDFEFFVFKTGEDKYIEVNVDVNGKSSDRSLYPFGEVHFNWHSEDFNKESPLTIHHVRSSKSGSNSESIVVDSDVMTDFLTIARGEAREKNLFVMPFAACVAIKLYDGSFVYASNPTIIWPHQMISSGEALYDDEGESRGLDYITDFVPVSPTDKDYRGKNLVAYGVATEWRSQNEGDFLAGGNIAAVYGYSPDLEPGWNTKVKITDRKYAPAMSCVITEYMGTLGAPSGFESGYVRQDIFINGVQLAVSIPDPKIIEDNNDIFSSICIFVTPEVDIYKYDIHTVFSKRPDEDPRGNGDRYWLLGLARYSYEEIIRQISTSNFYLLKEYDKKTITSLIKNPVIDLSHVEDQGLLSSIVQHDTLKTESLSRQTYLPRYAYSYNGRLHIANYKSVQFHGYPLDQFHKNNHSVKYVEGTTNPYLGLANLESNNDEYLQWPRDKNWFYIANAQQESAEEYVDLISERRGCFAYVKVNVKTDNGTQTAVRYILPFTSAETHKSYIEDLDPFLSFPDYRAESMEIKIVQADPDDRRVLVSSDTFPLKPHPCLNMAYYITDDMKPIDIFQWNGEYLTFSDLDDDMAPVAYPVEQNMQETYPNAIKVSKTDNPIFFPVANTYQIGSSEIVAMCSNAIAVGTGQTGEAPLYVFCKDGIYALFVDSSGQMTYTNARVIARDVCNNAASVTPIDEGVVFTTDRGLMMIAGNKVHEIGQPLEGDWCKFTREGDKDYSKHPAAAYEKVAELPADSITRDDFLTYLRDAIVSYNHNERELMVSNPQYRYTYILDRYGNWSRRDYRADEYVSNYPAVYRREGKDLYLVDEDSDEDNSIFALSNVIKMESIGFKELNRVVGRGYFETVADGYLRILVQGSYDGRKWVTLGHNTKRGKFRDMGCLVERTDCRFFRFVLAGKITKQSRFDYFEVSSKNSKLGAKIR